MKYNKILAVGMTGALLLNISGVVSPLNETFAVGDTTALNTDNNLQKAKDEALETLDDNGIKDNESIAKINSCTTVEQVRKTKKEIITKHREENRKKQEKEEQEKIKEEQRKKELEDILAELATGDKGVKLKETLGEEEYKKFYDNIKEKINDPKFTAQKAKSYLEKPELLKKDDELKEAKEKAKKYLKENGIDTEFFLKRIDSANKKELVEELTKQIISSHELQKAKEKAIKELDEYPEAFATLNNLADEAKKAKIKEINEASKEEEVQNILDKVKNAHNLNKAKKEGEAFLDKLTFKDATQKSEANKKIKNARVIEEVLNVSKLELKKALDGYSDVFSKKLYHEFVNKLKELEEQEIDKINSLEELNKKLDTIANANKIAKAKEEAKEKVKDMKELSFEEKTEAYNAIGSGSTLEEVNAEIKKAEEKESLKKEKANSLEKLDENGITDKESIDKINNATSVEEVKAIRKEIIKKHREENRKKQEKEEQERIKEEQRKKDLEDILAELATGDKGLELEKALGKEKIEKLINEIKQGLENPEYTKEKAKKELETLETKANELKEAKEKAKEELRKEGITSKLFLDKIDLAKTKESLDALKAEIIKSHKQEVLKKALKEAKEKLKLSYERANEFLGTENGKYYVYTIQKLVNEAYDYVEEGKDITLEKANKLAEDIEDAVKNVKKLSTKEEREEAKQHVDLKNIPDKVKELAKKDIDNAMTADDVKDIVSRVDVMDRKLSEKSLKEAKEKAKEELRKEGITSKLFLDKIDLAKTKEGVDALKTEIIKSHKQEILNKAKEEAKQHVDLKNIPDKVKELAKKDIDNAITVDDVRDIVSRVDVMDRKLSEKVLKEAKEKLKLSYDRANEFLTTEAGKYYVYPIQKLVNEAYDYVEEGKDITLEKANKLIEDIEDAVKNVKKLSTKEEREEAKQHVDLKNIPDKVKELAKKDIDNAMTADDVKDIVSRVDVMDRKLSEKSLKEAKEKAIAKLKEAGITGEIYFTQINNAKTVEGVNSLCDTLLKDHAQSVLKEAKTTALAELEKLDSLTNEEKDSFKEQINKATEKTKVSEALEQAKAKNTANKELKAAKEKAIAKLKEAGITGEIYFTQINNAKTVEGVNSLCDTLLKDHAQSVLKEAKANAIAKLKEAGITGEIYFKQINNAKTVEGVNSLCDTLLEDHAQSVFRVLKEAKANAIAKLRKAGLIGKIYLIDNIKTVEGVNSLCDALLKEHAQSVLKEAKANAIAKLKEAGITGEIYFKQINNAKTVEGVNSLCDTLLKDHAQSVLKEAKEAALTELEKLDSLTNEEKDSFKVEINKANNKEEVNTALEKAKELDKKHGAENPSVNPSPTPDITPTPNPTPTPEVKAGWQKDEIGWWYLRENGSFAKAEWEPVNGTWYHFDENGYMQTGWLNLDGTWYYLNDDGSMAKDTWIGTYYVDASGSWIIEGWQNSGYGWWYQRANGTYPHSEWEIINGIWYYFDSQGYMLAGATTPDGYYVDENGAWVK